MVESTDAYQKLIEAAELGESAQVLHHRLEAAKRGEKGIPADEVLAEIRSRLGIGQQR